MTAIFGLWAIGIFFRYIADFGTASALGGGLIVIFREHLLDLSILLAALAALFFMIGKLWPVHPGGTALRLSHRTKHTLAAIVALLPFAFWPMVQLFQGNSFAEVAPGLTSAFTTFLIVAAALSGGLRLLHLLKYKPASTLEQAVAGTALGFGALMFASFLMGITHLYYKPLAFLVVVGFLAFGWKDGGTFLAACRMGLRVHTHSKKRLAGMILAAIIFITLATILSAGMFLQYPAGYDAAISYLTYPKEYAQAHAMVAFPFWIYSGFPQNAEVLFTLGWLLGGFRVAAGIIYFFSLLIGGTILLFLRGRRPVAKILALLIFSTLPIITFQNFTEQKAEVIFAFYILISYAFVLKYARDRQRVSLLLCGIFSGIAAGLKYFFFPWYAIPIVLFLLWMAYRDRPQIKALVVWGLIAVALFAPWPIRNTILSGKPFDPISVPFAEFDRQTFFSQLGPEASRYVVTEMRNEAYLLWDDHERKDAAYFLRAPFDLTFMGNKKYLSDGLRIGPLLLIFLPVVLVATARRKFRMPTPELGFAIFSLPILVLGWIYLGHLAVWYAIPIYALFAVLSGWTIEESSSRRMRFAAIIAVCIWMVLFVSDEYHRRFTYSALYNPGNERRSSLWAISDFINRGLPAEAKVWGLNEPRGFYIDRSFARYIPDNYHLAFSWLLQERGAEGALKFLKDNGIEYLLIRGADGSPDISNVLAYSHMRNGSARYAELIQKNNRELVAFKDEYLEFIHGDGSYLLYRIKPR